MDKTLQRRVWRRARGCCEYCLMPQEHDDTPFEIDHVIAKKHEGPTAGKNLSLSCFHCNSFKGLNAAKPQRITNHENTKEREHEKSGIKNQLASSSPFRRFVLSCFRDCFFLVVQLLRILRRSSEVRI